MAERRNIAETILKYVVDRASIQNVVGSVKTVDKAISGSNNELKQLGLAASNSVGRLRNEFRSADREVEQNIRTLNEFERELKELDNVKVKPTIDVQQRVSGRSGGSAPGGFDVGRAGTLFSAAAGLDSLGGGALSGVLGEAGQVGDVIEGLSKLGGSLGQVAAASGIAGVALVGISLALAEFNKVIDAGKQSLDSALAAQDAYYSALREGLTSDEVRQQMAELQRSQPFLTQQINETQAAIDSTFQQLVDTMGEAAARAAVASGQTPITQLEERLKELRSEFDANNQAITRFSQGLGEGAFLQNDIAATLEKANETTAESIALITRLREEGLQRLGEGIETFLGNVVGGINRLVSISDGYTEQAERVAAAQQAIEQLRIEGAQRVADLTATSQDRQNTILQDGYDRAAELAEQYGIDRARAEEDLRRELARINGQIFDATAERDALAAFQLNKQKEQEEEAGELEARRREEDYRRELRQQAEATDKRLRAEQVALQRSLDQAERAWRAQLATREAALQAEQSALNSFVNNTVNGMSVVQAATAAYTDFMNARAVDATNLLDTLAQVAIDRMQAIYDADQNASVGAASGTVGYTPTAYASGGRFSAGTRAWVGEQGPELVMFDRPGRVFNTQQSQQMAASSNANIIIQMDGRSFRAASRREAARYVGELLGGQGIE